MNTNLKSLYDFDLVPIQIDEASSGYDNGRYKDFGNKLDSLVREFLQNSNDVKPKNDKFKFKIKRDYVDLP